MLVRQTTSPAVTMSIDLPQNRIVDLTKVGLLADIKRDLSLLWTQES